MRREIKYFSGLLLFMCCFLLVSCDEDDPFVPPLETASFIGQFSMDITHVSGIQTYYDSVGNITSQGLDTTYIASQILTISEGNSDTFLLAKLIRSFSHATTTIPATSIDDTLRLIYEFGEPQLRNNFVRGNAWLKGDSIFYDYRWNQSDIWSTGALPIFGTVTAKGKRM